MIEQAEQRKDSQPCGGAEERPCRANVNISRVGDIALSILDGTDLSGASGAQFFVGYGTSADEMISAGGFRITYQVP